MCVCPHSECCYISLQTLKTWGVSEDGRGLDSIAAYSYNSPTPTHPTHSSLCQIHSHVFGLEGVARRTEPIHTTGRTQYWLDRGAHVTMLVRLGARTISEHIIKASAHYHHVVVAQLSGV